MLCHCCGNSVIVVNNSDCNFCSNLFEGIFFVISEVCIMYVSVILEISNSLDLINI